jgi:alkyl sulfatase BDS1-like metallo-beta-lactamase superfamily hydrolase
MHAGLRMKPGTNSSSEMILVNLRTIAFGTVTFIAALAALSLSASQTQPQGDATAQTRDANASLAQQLPFQDTEDFEDARRGFVATLPDVTIRSADGRVVWSLKDYEFEKKNEAPPTVNPSLWRVARINLNNGLFKVTDRIYQVRGFDLSNMDIIEGDTGLIIIDPLVSSEVARAGLELYYQHRPKKPVSAVIYTHSHVDHYGGVKGVVSEDDVKSGKVKVLAPEGFLEEAVSENVFAGNAMSRRATYMYGVLLPKGERGQVDGGLGKTTSLGTITLIPPTDLIEKTGETRTIDGVEMTFQMAPRTEAPAEFLIHFPQFRALCAAEDATHTFHNLYTLRGAQVRDAKNWWKALNESMVLFGDKTEVVFAQHHWPKWGQKEILNYLKKQRDLYKYIHDQTLRLMNHGYTMLEVAEMLKLPGSLDREWYNRDYYGSVNHNAKAVYQRYLGWYDSNPANLYPLPPEESAKKYVEFMGGPQAVIARARESFNKGEYRWVAQVMNHVVFADPKNREGRELQAAALEQLGYQTENPTWRNEFLTGAFELRNGVPRALATRVDSRDTLRAMTLEMLLDYLGIRLNGPKAEGKTISLNWYLTDTGEKYAVTLENAALTYTADKQLPDADATMTLTRETLNRILMGRTTPDKEIEMGKIQLQGNREKLAELLSLMDSFEPMFNIVTP